MVSMKPIHSQIGFSPEQLQYIACFKNCPNKNGEMPFARLFSSATSHLRNIHLSDILFARHFNCAPFQLRDLPVARHFNCAVSHLRNIPVARHPICATFQLRDIPSARQPICVTCFPHVQAPFWLVWVKLGQPVLGEVTLGKAQIKLDQVWQDQD